MQIRPVGAELFHADGRTDRQTDMTKLTFAFRNFTNALKKSFLSIFLLNLSEDEINLTIYPARMQFLLQWDRRRSCHKTARYYGREISVISF